MARDTIGCMPSLASLAAELGVSRTTVSNAFNNPDQLSEALRERILAAAKAQGYAGPDPMARSLRTQKTGAVGVVLTEELSFAFEDRASVDFLAGLSSIKNYSLTLIPACASVHDAIVDGIVVYSVPEHDPQLQQAIARGLPLVVCDQPKQVDAPFVGIDDYTAIQSAAHALKAAGHTRVGILAKRMFSTPFNGEVADVSLADLDVQRARVEGARAVLGNVPVVTRHLNDIDSAADGARELLTRHPDLTAVLCTTDSMALGVLAAYGDRVPHDLSVAGFDGIEAAELRSLSTVRQPNHLKGTTTATLLSDLLAGDSPSSTGSSSGISTRVLLDTEFIPGATITPPRTD